MQRQSRLIVIPDLVFRDFKACGSEPAYVVNTVTQPYSPKKPDEFRIDPPTTVYLITGL